MAKGPVFGMQVDEMSAHWSYDHDGTTYSFCSPRCLNAFQADPEKYLGDESANSGAPHRHHQDM